MHNLAYVRRISTFAETIFVGCNIAESLIHIKVDVRLHEVSKIEMV